ncbi:beta-ketoacyl synthase N-terminal-like domain-containing protein [Streptomyces candidus]|uniref:3-oxoacyl-[acyl-carrier-protein] synthase II n=1 Tax=Streptomyces candidus TaxID=67283 RepID=A0A7X0LRB2_9ACTN|nr:beta-ketoacyl synthase N-terminal-like domain-containing protein [Streptomyces candidus]MBB6436771.1 3-oxoacyl-[acyl-carrier-protein] synthase II [Streptomyces candidus]GHH51341.1 3-oxoacyl-ACP synthase [Streptomyces candidus]
MNITAWSALSPYGHTAADFTTGVRQRRATAAPVPGAHGQLGCLVPLFEPRTALGRKGTRHMNRVTALAVTAVGAVLDHLDHTEGGGQRGLDTALVLGTTTGSVQSMTDFTRSSLTGERPYDVEPGVIPNSVMNCAAAQCAIRHRIQGPNTTLAAGRTAALLGLLYARRLLRAGRARSVLCGGAEEYTTARAWLEARSRAATPPPPAGAPRLPGEGPPPSAAAFALLGEGAAVLRLTPADMTTAAPPLATVLAVETRHTPEGTDPAATVRATVTEALARSGVAADDVWAATGTGLDPAETRALDALFSRQVCGQLPTLGLLLGDTGAASAALQLAAVVASAGQAPGGHAVITSVDGQGVAAAAVLRMGEGV